jgi:hypothetical protein
VIDLVGHDRLAAEVLVERSFADQGGEPDRIRAGEDPLPVQPDLQPFVGLLDRYRELSMIERM